MVRSTRRRSLSSSSGSAPGGKGPTSPFVSPDMSSNLASHRRGPVTHSPPLADGAGSSALSGLTGSTHGEHNACVTHISRERAANMSEHLEGVFEVTSWSEEQVGGLEGAAKVTTAGIGQRFTGGIEAETKWDMVMAYRDDGTADFVGYQRLQGRICDKEGTFVLQGLWQFDGTEAS